MDHFTSYKDVKNTELLLQQISRFKNNPRTLQATGKTLGLIFFNPSLRTRLSTQKAACNLGMNVIVQTIGSESWNIEMTEGAVMNGSTQEHIKDAVKVLSSYCDVLGVRSFPDFKNVQEDYQEPVLEAFKKYSSVPVISLESATLHPLQSLTDIFTIRELGIKKPKIALTWTPHPRVLPQSVPNSFLEWASAIDGEVIVAHPEGYDLHSAYQGDFEISHVQEEALKGADIVYAKNWSSYKYYGTCPEVTSDWTVTSSKMTLTRQGQFMHCMPVRRNVTVTDEVLDNSLIYTQAANRQWAAQAVLAQLLNLQL